MNKIKLFPHQQRALDSTKKFNRVAYYLGYGRDVTFEFVQYQAGAMGLNLQKANKVIYFTLPQSSELFEQSKKRVHRIGQKNRCFYYYMMCSNSVEEVILETLNQRKDFTDELFKECEI